MARLHLPCPALPAPALPLPEERFASRLAAGTFLLSGDARPALGIPAAALRLAIGAHTITEISTGGYATALGVMQQLKMSSTQSQKHVLVVVHQLMPKLVLQLKQVRHSWSRTWCTQ